ncbi:hypothetical protein ACFR9U_10730 [Halorientalis brevis]|uniref:Uncharacterized protein n=1 Tax=Halorientalis brevis TaxID=1126241 RepID=A0ABD6CCP7_9EURY|nr:hypothetical protein [Halorientalis brevis]
MSPNRDSLAGSWLKRQLVVFGGVSCVSAVLVKLLWLTTLSELYGTLAVDLWLSLSVALSVAIVFYVRTDAL